MSSPESRKFNQSFPEYKAEKGIEHDPEETLEGLWMWEQDLEIKRFEQEYPGIHAEFEVLISLLPRPNDSNKEEFPFAASVVRLTADGKMEVLARATNRVNARKDSTQHAELAAMQDAAAKLGEKDLRGCMLLSTAQPCEMCAGAVRHSDISTVVYAVSQKDLEGKHVKFQKEFKPHRTVPADFDVDEWLRRFGITVVAGYKQKEVLATLQRFVGSFAEYYRDPDK